MSIKKKTALFDENGKRISDYYDYLTIMSCGTIQAIKGGEAFYNKRNQDGTLFCKEFYKNNILMFGNNYAIRVTLEDGSHNLMTREGKLLLKRRDYTVINNSMKSYYALVQKNGKYNIVDKNGCLISKVWFNAISFDECNTTDGWKVELPNGKYNILKRDGTFVFKRSVEYSKLKEALG